MVTTAHIAGLTGALGIGLLIGLERERRMSAGGDRSTGGIRTFAIASLLGAVAITVGQEPLLIAALVSGSLLLSVAHFRTTHHDPGLTTAVSLLLTILLGGLAMADVSLAVGIGVVAAVLLAAREILHGFIRATLTEQELRDGLILATAALVIWPVLPDRPIGPLDSLNLHSLWRVVVLVMAVGAAGYAGTRLLGPQRGLPFTGFASGFISSTATIWAMGEKAAASPALLVPAVAGTMLSTVATYTQLGLVLAAISNTLFLAMLPILAIGGIATLLYAGLFAFRPADDDGKADTSAGRAFAPRTALLLAGMLAIILVITAVLNRLYGTSGVLIGAGFAGLADVHTPTAAIASLAAGGQIDTKSAMLAVLIAITTNAASKTIVAAISPSRAFARRVIPGLALITAATWAGALAVLSRG
jgi:uncharacterized membrane protein (DUF4010 family)